MAQLFSYGSAVRKILYTTNAVESVNSSFRKVTKKGAFPNENALLKLLYLCVNELYKNGIQNIMQNNLVIVESPAKAKTIEKFLGEGYKVLSSYGHIRDLKQKAFSIDIKSHFKPIYEIPEDKKKLVAELQREGVKIIASSHDFDKTDSQEILLDRFREMEKSGADILKMAVMPHGFEDVAAIMEETNAMRKECEKPLVSMAMGSIGSISRISGENFGSGITFGTVGAASAPGQFPIGELRSLLEALHQKNLEA